MSGPLSLTRIQARMLWLSMLCAMSACTGQWGIDQWGAMSSLNSEPPVSTLFVPSPEDKKYFQTIGKAQEQALSLCTDDPKCVKAHFLRALTALYESPELASHHFQKVVAANPTGYLAKESRFWLWLLEGAKADSGRQAGLGQVGKRLVRELVLRQIKAEEDGTKDSTAVVQQMQHDLSGQDAVIKDLSIQVQKLTRQLELMKNETDSIQAVRQELKARDKKVEELTHQLDALRRIDQEIKEKAPPTRPSDKILNPSEEGKSANTK